MSCKKRDFIQNASSIPTEEPWIWPDSCRILVLFLDGLVVQPIGRTQPFLGVMAKLLGNEKWCLHITYPFTYFTTYLLSTYHLLWKSSGE